MNDEEKQYKVYLFYYEFDNTPYVKIGFTRNVKARKASLQTPETTLYSIVSEGMNEQQARLLEELLHGYFSDYRRNGEWFIITKDSLKEFMTLYNMIARVWGVSSFRLINLDNSEP